MLRTTIVLFLAFGFGSALMAADGGKTEKKDEAKPADEKKDEPKADEPKKDAAPE